MEALAGYLRANPGVSVGLLARIPALEALELCRVSNEAQPAVSKALVSLTGAGILPALRSLSFLRLVFGQEDVSLLVHVLEARRAPPIESLVFVQGTVGFPSGLTSLPDGLVPSISFRKDEE